jgi:hypothetical protein
MELRSQLLQFIMKNDGEVGFHQVVRRFGVLDSSVNLVDEIETLVHEHLIEERQIREGIQPVYFLTEQGRKELK